MVFTRELASAMGFDASDSARIQLALEEVVTNVIKHGLAGDENTCFDLQFHQSTAGLTIIIREKGIPFDPSVLKPYVPGKKIRLSLISQIE